MSCHYFNSLNSFAYILIVLISSVHSHGHMIYPVARQANCKFKGGFNDPPDGSGIQDPGCRAAFQYVKSLGHEGGYQFEQFNEVAANAGSNFSDLEGHIKKDVVPTNLCGAHANGLDGFGDKSGLSVVANWTPTTIQRGSLTMEFCATAVHDPSYWEIFISNNNYNPTQKTLEWTDLDYHASFYISATPRSQQSQCQTTLSYIIPLINLPDRNQQFVIYSRWQRNETQVGEGFYNCMDVKY